jgi:hypothetical protein
MSEMTIQSFHTIKGHNTVCCPLLINGKSLYAHQVNCPDLTDIEKEVLYLDAFFVCIGDSTSAHYVRASHTTNEHELYSEQQAIQYIANHLSAADMDTQIAYDFIKQCKEFYLALNN